MVEKLKKRRIGKKYPFHQPIRRQHSDIRWNYHFKRPLQWWDFHFKHPLKWWGFNFKRPLKDGVFFLSVHLNYEIFILSVHLNYGIFILIVHLNDGILNFNVPLVFSLFTNVIQHISIYTIKNSTDHDTMNTRNGYNTQKK